MAGQVLHVLPDVEGALEGAHDEDECHQGGEQLLGEAGDVADVGAGVEGHEEEEHHPGPDTNPQPIDKKNRSWTIVKKNHNFLLVSLFIRPLGFYHFKSQDLTFFCDFKLSNMFMCGKF